MEEFITILKSAEENLQKAKKNLQQLESSDISDLFKQRIIPVTKSYQQIEEAIWAKKETLLKLLIEATIASGKKFFKECCWYRYNCELSLSEITVSGGDWRGHGVVNKCGKYSLRQFMQHSELQYDFFIKNHLLVHLSRFLRDSSSSQKSQVSIVQRNLDKCSQLAESARLHA